MGIKAVPEAIAELDREAAPHDTQGAAFILSAEIFATTSGWRRTHPAQS
jgi:hypothetical protein